MFNRKPKNRRFERKHVLDVKVSSARRRQIWFRRLAMLLMVVFMGALGLFVVGRGGDYVLEKLVYTNPAFAIHNVDIETDGVLSLDQLRAWAGVRLRSNLMKLDLGRIKRDLELVPVIESAAVERILPHTLRIRVTEREAVAQVFLPPYLNPDPNHPVVYTLDAKGCFMFPVEGPQRAIPTATNAHLPALVGLPVSELRPGRQTGMPQVQAALRLIQAFKQSPMAGRVELRQINLSEPFILKVLTDQNSTIVFSLQKPEFQLHRWTAIYEHGLRLGKQVAWMDLSVANNVPVRWQEPPAATPMNSKYNPRSTFTKKHV